MDANPPKKPPATVTGEPPESNTRSAYEHTNFTRHVAGRTVTQWKTGFAPKKKSPQEGTHYRRLILFLP